VISPISDPLCATPRPIPTPPPRVPAPTVLLVEDSPAQRKLVAYMLRDAGAWNNIEAPNGPAALEQLATALPDVILTDMYMPDMDGLELVEHLRVRHPHVPVVLMTGKGSEQMAVDALKTGAADYVPKKTMAGTVAGALLRAIENARAETGRIRVTAGMTERLTRFSLENDPALVGPLVAGVREDLLAQPGGQLGTEAGRR
jgi:DNA-binding NtrC family response regulator